MKYSSKEYKFGDFMEFVISNKYTAVFIGINDLLSSKSWNEFDRSLLGNKNIASLSLNYDQNKSLMLDLNIKRVPIIQLYKEGTLVEEVYPPKIKTSELEGLYEKHFGNS
ncbi:MAG: hypothetical protein N3A54_03895 [Patescibacteria group bacterium]|nr:hypothetical protein [Patescibacteria group bacterium]